MTTKHVLGYNRTVINKKPRRYTKNYNYREQQWKQSPTANHSEARDSKRPAKEPGWRPVYNSKGEVDHYYFERRINRSDTRAQRNVALGYRANKHRTGYGRRRIIAKYKPTIKIIEPKDAGTTGGTYFKSEPKQQKPQKSKLEKLINDTELGIHRNPKERCYIFDSETCSIAFVNNGTSQHVSIGTLSGPKYILTHNHPNNYENPNGFSGQDIKALLIRDFQEMRACSFGYVFRVKPGTADPNRYAYYKRVYNTRVTKAINKATAKLKDFEYFEGDTTQDVMERAKIYKQQYNKIACETIENVMESFFREFGFWYRKEKL